MNKYLLSKLKNNLIVTARTAIFKTNKIDLEWSEWLDFKIFVQHRANGEIATLALKDAEWAEYSVESYNAPSECHPNGVFIAEEYFLEIKLKEKI